MGGRAIGPMAWVGWRHWSVCCAQVWVYNFHDDCANAFFNNGHALEALGDAHLEPHLEPKATRRPTHILVDAPAHPPWHARTAGVRSRTPRVRAPMDSTRAFGHPRVSMELAMIPLPWPQAGVLASENIGGQWGSTPHGASRRAHRLRALIDVHGALPALNARLPCPRMRHAHILTDVFVSRTRVGSTYHGRRRRRYCRHVWAWL